MNAPTSITLTITPVRVTDLLAEGERMRVRALDPQLVWLAHEHEPWRLAPSEASPAPAKA